MIGEVMDVAIAGAGLSALGFLSTYRGPGPVVALEYRDRPGGSLAPVLPSHEFREESMIVQHVAGLEETVRTGATAVGLLPALRSGEPHTLLVRTRVGTENLRARRVVIASGGLECTRESGQIPGSRPAGVVTPVLVHEFLDRGLLPGRTAVLFGAGRYVSETARRMLGAGIDTTVVVPLRSLDAIDPDIPSIGRSRLVTVSGRSRLESVTVQEAGAAAEMVLTADLLVYAAGMEANVLWLKGSGVDLTPDGRVAVDGEYRTSIAGVHAIGTAVRPLLDHDGSVQMGRELAAQLEAAA